MIKSTEDINKVIEEIKKSKDYMQIIFDGEEMFIKKPKEEEFKFTLFHGTSRYMLDKLCINEEVQFCENSKMDYKYALEIVECLVNLVGKESIKDVMIQLFVDKVFDKENKFYEYKNMCLTTDVYNAKRYAEDFLKVGELNSCILYLYKEAEKCEMKIPAEYMEYIRDLKTAVKSEGVVLFVKDLSYKDICMNEGEEKISFDKLLRDTIFPAALNVHYHGQDTDNVEVVSLDQLNDRYMEYRKELKEKLERLRIYPLRDQEFESENLKRKAMFFYRKLF